MVRRVGNAGIVVERDGVGVKGTEQPIPSVIADGWDGNADAMIWNMKRSEGRDESLPYWTGYFPNGSRSRTLDVEMSGLWQPSCWEIGDRGSDQLGRVNSWQEAFARFVEMSAGGKGLAFQGGTIDIPFASRIVPNLEGYPRRRREEDCRGRQGK